jgi:hypothetical protein
MAKPFVLTDESLNAYGFWIKTEGLDWSLFDQNPLMLFMHIRPGEYQNLGKDMLLPLGCWKERKKEGNLIMATPEFDQDDEFAKKIEKKVEKGIIRMASIGVQVLEWSKSPEDLKPLQTRPTVKRAIVKEASIADLGGNYNALRLYDESGQMLTLSQDPAKCAISLINQSNQNQLKMKNVIGLLKLADTANEAEVYQAIVKLNEKITALEADKVKLDAEILKLKTSDEAEQKARVKTMIDAAVRDRKILESSRADYVALAEKDFDNTKKILDGMTVMTKLADGTDNTGKKNKFEGKTWKDLDKSGSLEELKLADISKFKDLYKEEFGKEYKG